MLLCHIVLARSLGVTGFGEYAQAITWFQVLCVIGKLGLDNTSLRYVSEYVTKGETGKLRGFAKDSTRASVFASTIIMLCLIAIAWVFWNAIGERLASCLMIAAAMIPLVTLRQIQEASLRGVGQLFNSQISMAIWPLILFVLAGIVWQISPSSMTSPVATFLQLISVGIVSAIVYRFLRHSPLKLGDETAMETCRRQWTNSAVAFLVAELLIVLKSRVCVAMAGILLGRDSAGLYAAMERFADVSILGGQSLGLVIAPQFAALFAAGRYPEMRRLMRQGQILGLAFTVPVAIVVACLGDFVFVLLGTGYREGWTTLVALLVSACITSFAGPAAYVLQMTGRERTMLVITAACAVSNIVLSLVLMGPFGILGLGFSQIVTSLVWTIGVRLSLSQHPAWQHETSECALTESGFGSKDVP